MKKLVCLILALTLLAVCTACSGGKDYSEYGKSAVLEIGSASAKPGSTVELEISVHNNPGTSTIGLELEYDTAVLTPVSASASGVLKGVGFFTSNLDGADEYGAFGDDEGSTLQAIWFNTADFKDNGKVMTVEFKIADDAPAGEYAIKAIKHEDDFTNQNLEYVDVAYINGTVTVN